MAVLLLRLWGTLQWLFCPDTLKYFSDYLIYTLQAIIAGRFFLALRRHIGHSASSTADVIHVAPSRKIVAGLEGETISSMTFRRDLEAQSTSPFSHPSRSRGRNTLFSFSFSDMTPGLSSSSSHPATASGELIQMSAVLGRDFELERAQQLKSSTQISPITFDDSQLGLEVCRTKSEPTADPMTGEEPGNH
ncbi:hypothetical protein FRC17_009862 [Serendipita sp. 399]|nr:hypothetical protein FRC17_009862 [Serendipita sp. 399]